MKGVKVKPGNAALSSDIIDFAVPATNASPLDLARLATGGKLRRNRFLFAEETRTVPGSPLHPPSGTFPVSRKFKHVHKSKSFFSHKDAKTQRNPFYHEELEEHEDNT